MYHGNVSSNGHVSISEDVGGGKRTELGRGVELPPCHCNYYDDDGGNGDKNDVGDNGDNSGIGDGDNDNIGENDDNIEMQKAASVNSVLENPCVYDVVFVCIVATSHS